MKKRGKSGVKSADKTDEVIENDMSDVMASAQKKLKVGPKGGKKFDLVCDGREMNEEDLNSKMDQFKDMLKDQKQTENNATIMGQMIKLLSQSLNIEISEIMTNLSQEQGDINMGKLKEKLEDR